MKKIIIIILLLFMVGCNKKEEINSSIKVNTNELVISEQRVSDFSIKPISLFYEGGISSFSISITNLKEIDTKISKIEVQFLLENGTILTTIVDDSTYEIKAGETIYLSLKSDLDLSEIYSVNYIIS